MDDMERFKHIKNDIKNLSDQKIRLEERFNREKINLENLIKEIKERGYDPKKLTEIRKEKEKLSKEKLDEIEIQVKEIQNKLNVMEIK